MTTSEFDPLLVPPPPYLWLKLSLLNNKGDSTKPLGVPYFWFCVKLKQV